MNHDEPDCCLAWQHVCHSLSPAQHLFYCTYIIYCIAGFCFHWGMCSPLSLWTEGQSGRIQPEAFKVKKFFKSCDTVRKRVSWLVSLEVYWILLASQAPAIRKSVRSRNSDMDMMDKLVPHGHDMSHPKRLDSPFKLLSQVSSCKLTQMEQLDATGMSRRCLAKP